MVLNTSSSRFHTNEGVMESRNFRGLGRGVGLDLGGCSHGSTLRRELIPTSPSQEPAGIGLVSQGTEGEASGCAKGGLGWILGKGLSSPGWWSSHPWKCSGNDRMWHFVLRFS